jgi:hypothetical protein
MGYVPSVLKNTIRSFLNKVDKEIIKLRRSSNLLNQPGVQTLLFCLGFVLFNWPFLGIFQLKQPAVLFFYLFLIWAIAILLLFLMGRSYSRATFEENKESEGQTDA